MKSPGSVEDSGKENLDPSSLDEPAAASLPDELKNGSVKESEGPELKLHFSDDEEEEEVEPSPEVEADEKKPFSVDIGKEVFIASSFSASEDDQNAYPGKGKNVIIKVENVKKEWVVKEEKPEEVKETKEEKGNSENKDEASASVETVSEGINLSGTSTDKPAEDVQGKVDDKAKEPEKEKVTEGDDDDDSGDSRPPRLEMEVDQEVESREDCPVLTDEGTPNLVHTLALSSDQLTVGDTKGGQPLKILSVEESKRDESKLAAKRSIEEQRSNGSKKLCIEKEEDEVVVVMDEEAAPSQNDPPGQSLYDLYLKKNFKGLTKHMLEELITQKFCDVLANRGAHGEMRLRVAQLEEDFQRLNKLNNSLRKQLQDAKHIIKRLIEEREVQKRTGRVATPLRVTRSVGLQVCTSGTFYMRPKAEFRQMAMDKVIDLEEMETGVGGVTIEHPPIPSPKPARPELPPAKCSPAKLIIERAVVPPSTMAYKKTNQPVTTSSPNLVHRAPGSLPLPPLLPSNTRVTLQPTTINNINFGTPTQDSKKNDDNVHSKTNMKTRILPTSTPGVQHYIIAAPVKTLPLNTNSPQVVTHTVEKQGSVSNTSMAMEVIDLTDKDEKTGHAGKMKVQATETPMQNGKLGAHTSRVSYLIPAAPVSALNQTHHLKVTQVAHKKTPEVTKEAKPSKMICSVANFTGSKQTNGKSPKTDEAAGSKSKLPPLPLAPKYGIIPGPPRPLLRICKSNAGIMLSWNFGNHKAHTEVATFELFAYQERGDVSVPRVWNKVGEVKALPLPMACTLTQFVEGQKYHFAVRAIDIHDRIGEFSSPGSIMLTLADQ